MGKASRPRHEQHAPAAPPVGPGYLLSPLKLFAGGLALLAVGFTAGVLVQSQIGTPPVPARPAVSVAAPPFGSTSAGPSLAQTEALQTIEQLRRHLAHAPEDLAARTQLGNALFDAGSYTDAIAEYQAVLEKQPGDADVRTDLGTAYHRTGRGDLAAAQFRQVIQQFPDHPNAHHNLGVVLSEQGDARGARAAWERFLLLAPNSPMAAEVRGLLQQLKPAK